MYILKIETSNTEAVKVLKEIYFDNKYTETFENGVNYVYESVYLMEGNAKQVEKYYKDLLKDFDDWDTSVYWEEEDDDKEDNNPFAINPYDENGVNEKDFY